MRRDVITVRTQSFRAPVIAAAVAAAVAATLVGGAQLAAGDAAARAVEVGTAEELSEALAAAQPDDTIRLAPGDYDGTFYATAEGTADEPITLTGPRDAVLSNREEGCDPEDFWCYGLHLNRASHWDLAGFAVAEAAKGIVLDDSRHVTIDGVEIPEVGAEAVHFRDASSDNTIRDSFIHDTGLEEPEYGEGIYFGSAENHWDEYGEDDGEGPDRSDRNHAIHNTIGPGGTAEHIDIHEGTEGGVVRANTFDGHGVSGENHADRWVAVKGNGYLIESNTGTYDGAGALEHGYQVNSVVDGCGCGNTFRDNDSDLRGAEGYAIHLPDDDACANVVHADNTATGAGSGLTNVSTTGSGGS
jgi:hypothetical protein